MGPKVLVAGDEPLGPAVVGKRNFVGRWMQLMVHVSTHLRMAENSIMSKAACNKRGWTVSHSKSPPRSGGPSALAAPAACVTRWLRDAGNIDEGVNELGDLRDLTFDDVNGPASLR